MSQKNSLALDSDSPRAFPAASNFSNNTTPYNQHANQEPYSPVSVFSVAFLQAERRAIMLAYLTERPSITGMVTQNFGASKMAPLLGLQLKILLKVIPSSYTLVRRSSQTLSCL